MLIEMASFRVNQPRTFPAQAPLTAGTRDERLSWQTQRLSKPPKFQLSQPRTIPAVLKLKHVIPRKDSDD